MLYVHTTDNECWSATVVPLVGLILLRDVSLLAGGVIRRYRSLPKPVTLSRFFRCLPQTQRDITYITYIIICYICYIMTKCVYSVSKVESIEIKPTVISKARTNLNAAARRRTWPTHEILWFGHAWG
jgi:hypothetical protein